jgi:hypothetical protein
LKLSENRTDEIIALAEQGVTPPVKLIDLLEQQIQRILITAGSMNDDAFTRTLLQLREFLQTQQNRISEHQIIQTGKLKGCLCELDKDCSFI